MRSSSGRDTFPDCIGGEDRILDNGVDNDTAVAVRRDKSAEIFVGKGNRHYVQLSDKNIRGGVHLDTLGKYIDGLSG